MANNSERVIRSIKQAISSFYCDNQKHWDNDLHLILIALNNATHSSTRFSPAKLFLGINLLHPLSLKCEFDPEFYQTEDPSKLKKLWCQAFHNLQVANDQVAKQYNKNKGTLPFKIGDLVMYKNYTLSRKIHGRNGSLLPKFTGPYKIEKIRSRVSYVLSSLYRPFG